MVHFFYQRFLSVVSSQLSVSCEIYSYHGRISSVLRQNRKKDCNKVAVDRKLFLKAWSIE